MHHLDEDDEDKEIFEISDDILNLEEIKTFKANDYGFSLENLNKYVLELFPGLPSNYKEKPARIDFVFSFSNPYKVFFHNRGIGATYEVLQKIINIPNQRIFYLNINYLVNNKTIEKWNNYFSFFISMIFHNNEIEEYEKFYKEKILKIFMKGVFELKMIIEQLIKYFEGKNDELKKILFIFDNIHLVKQYNEVILVEENINKCLIYKFISLNDDTFNLFEKYLKEGTNFYFINLKEMSNLDFLDDFNEYKNYLLLKEEFLEQYNKRIINESNQIMNSFSSQENFINLMILMNFINKNEDSDFIYYWLPYLRKYIDYIYLKVTNKKVVKIVMKNNTIKDIFIYHYIYSKYFTLSDNLNNSIDVLLGSQEGINFEKQIIYSILLKKFSQFYDWVKIYQIFCIKDIPYFDKNKNILFYQINSYSPLYDFGILLSNNNIKTLKSYQIGINKTIPELNKINKNIIILDLSYFVEFIKRKFNVNILNCSFGIITTIKAKDNELKYNNFKNMKEYCHKNKYEFILFDSEKIKIFLNNSFELNNTDEYIEINDFNFYNEQFIFKKIQMKKKIRKRH